MKTLSSALLTELGLTVTRPGYLIQLGFSSTLYLSTMGDISFLGQTWIGADIKVTGLSQDGSGNSSGTLEVGNTDGAYGAITLLEGASDIPVVIWVCYAGATASGDPVPVFSGVIDGADINFDKVNFALVPVRNTTMYSPRIFISKPTFNFLQATGKTINIGGETFVLTR